MSFPEPTTALEAKLLSILQVAEGGIQMPACWDLVHILEAAAKDKTYFVYAQSVFYRSTLWNHPEVYLRVKPYIRLSDKATKKLQIRYAALACKEAGSGEK